jgi:hypothetical protein
LIRNLMPSLKKYNFRMSPTNKLRNSCTLDPATKSLNSPHFCTLKVWKLKINYLITLWDSFLCNKSTSIRLVLMKKNHILIQKFGSQLEAEHNSRKTCKKSLGIFNVFVNIASHVQFFISVFLNSLA